MIGTCTKCGGTAKTTFAIFKDGCVQDSDDWIINSEVRLCHGCFDIVCDVIKNCIINTEAFNAGIKQK